MAVITVDENGNKVETVKIRMMFVCDSCGNKFPFSHGMETFRLTYKEGPSGVSDDRSFCSQLCVTKVIKEEQKRTC